MNQTARISKPPGAHPLQAHSRHDRSAAHVNLLCLGVWSKRWSYPRWMLGRKRHKLHKFSFVERDHNIIPPLQPTNQIGTSSFLQCKCTPPSVSVRLLEQISLMGI